MKSTRGLFPLTGAALFSGLLALTGFIKVSFIVGSQEGFFSAVNILTPLSGAFGGVWFSCVVLLFSCVLRGFFDPFTFLLHHIPGFCASLYWATPSVFIRFILPLVCMTLFVMHPVGLQAFAYSFFWLIPLALYLSRTQNLFLLSLGSTFTAHAVGSVIWLYTSSIPATTWYALIPVVVIERLVFASGMTLAYVAWERANRWFATRYFFTHKQSV